MSVKWKEIVCFAWYIIILKNQIWKRSDKYKVQIDKTSGLIQYDGDVNNKCMTELPYAMKLMIQELQTMCINTRFLTETQVTNKNCF